MSELLDRLTLALADRYGIVREIGRGGMATVFVARDLKHDRDVAVKVFRPELAASIGVDRFLREIRITAKFNHPHIMPLLDSGEDDGLLYYVMPYVEGETLRDRLNREGQLPVDEAVRVSREVAAALSYAHSRDVVHRDIKPENVLLSAGEAVVADFGIARAVTEASTGRVTETGISIGTPAYMSPEQASGDHRIDGRADIYALGCMLYEMLSGDAPFSASTPAAALVKKLTEPTPRISAIRESVPPAIEAALTKALAKNPADRFATAQQFAEALAVPGDAIAGSQVRPATAEGTGGRGRRTRVAVVVALTIAAVAAFTAWFVPHRSNVRWARDVALPEIARQIDENDVWRNLVPAYHLAERAEAVLGEDSVLAGLFSKVSLRMDVRTEPPGARVFMKEYGDPASAWTALGTTPLEQVRVPIGAFRWKFEMDGYEPVEAAAATWDIGGPEVVAPYTLVRTLDTLGGMPPGMVRVPSTETPLGTLPDFFVDRYEVTNREYKAFVDAGGYGTRDYWKYPFVRNGQALTWGEAMREFVDQSGRPGPSTWLGGDFPRDRGDYPVSGVSWYEAAAYAEYAGKSLPTDVHWNVARGGLTPMIQWPQLGGFGVLAPFANFGGEGPVAVGSLPGITAYGAYDMAGNVREWCWNETPQGRLIRGGAWGDNTYEFGNRRQAPPMDRSDRNGIRLVVYPERDEVPDAAFGFATLGNRDILAGRAPVSDAIFQVYREQFAYDATPLEATVERREESPGGWIRETVSFDAAYGGERVLAHLFLPANAAPPYQAVIYFPGSAATWMTSSDDLEHYYEFSMFVSFLVRSGRAVLFPVYKGTFERSSPALSALHRGAPTHAFTEFVIQVVKDFRRSVDYLEARPDIDHEKLAYYGMSWGGVMGAIIPAVERRLAASVLVAAGLEAVGRPEVLDLNFVTRVTAPTLMLGGKYDNIFGVEQQVTPMFELLGTPAEHKRLILYDTDHIPPRPEYIKETLAWLDTYLGPVGR